MRKIAKPSFMRAVALRDHNRIAELIAAGDHPLAYIERCIEMRAHGIETLMVHVRRDQVGVEIVERVIKHLEMIDRYPAALEVLNDWVKG
jgi:hypothetical protein